ncbi:MAG: sugar phosphate isomerase/epimerase family protein [Bacteroidota bacterium]
MKHFDRRNFLMALPLLSMTRAFSLQQHLLPEQRFKLSLNAYSFNDWLMQKKISPLELLDFCQQTGFDAIDFTGYYFSTYPGTPSNDEIYTFKRKAHALGLEISGTGIRNEFSFDKGEQLEKEIDLVKRWIEVAAKLGAPVLRIYTAKKYYTGEERKKILENIQWSLHKCLPEAASHGVILGIQNHNDFLQTSDECHALIKSMNSKWLGLVLDTGNFIAEDPYEEIKKSVPLAVNWQLKEKLLINGIQTPMDLERLCKIIKASDYHGTIPIETLGMKDPLNEVPVFFKKVKEVLFS